MEFPPPRQGRFLRALQMPCRWGAGTHFLRLFGWVDYDQRFWALGATGGLPASADGDGKEARADEQPVPPA